MMQLRRLCVPALVVAVSLALLAPASVATAPGATAESPALGGAAESGTAESACVRSESSSAPIDRVAGADRYATAACMAEAVYPDGAEHVLLARGDAAGGLADALTGAVLAHALEAPVLLTVPDRLPEATRRELARLGPERVTILGGRSAVSLEVEAGVVDLGIAVDRIDGVDRATTAARVAEAAAQVSGEPPSTVFVVNGHRPADSLVAAAPAARAGAALLLVGTDTVPRVTAEALEGASEVIIVGGHGVVADAVAADLRRAVGGGDVRRVAGGNRGQTAAAVARAFPTAGRRYLANEGDAHLVDAVTAGWAAARPDGGPVLYTRRDEPGRPADRYLRLGGLGDGAALEPARLVGGTAALSAGLVDVLEDRYAEAGTGGPSPEVRAVWVHLFDDALKSRAGIARVLDAAVAAELNTVVVQVARRQDAYYRSDVLPRTVDPRMPGGLDLLAELVPAARDRGLQVHAWVSVLPAYHSTYSGLNLGPDHVWTRHGPNSSTPWTTRSRTGATSVFLDPGVGGVQDHVAAVLRELAERYDVDAVHVDYLRYEGEAWGYHPTSLSRFRAQTGVSGTPAVDDAEWGAWRRAQTRDLARRILLEVIDADPDVAVSLAASTMGPGPATAGDYRRTRTYRDVFQDWPSWLENGLIDAAFPMNYFREGEHRAWFDDWVAFEAGLARGDRVLAVGQAAYLNSVSASTAQLERARRSTDGVVVYSYQQNAVSGNPQGLLGSLPRTLFTDPAPAPALPQRPAGRGYLLAEVAGGDGAAVSATPAGGGGARGPVRADATGRAGFLELAPGAWTVSAPGYTPATVTVEAGEVTRATLRRDG